MPPIWIIVAIVLAAILALVFLYDITQNKNPILKNFPVLGHMRSFLIEIGPGIRQYLVASNREEAPFNRSEREWIYRSADKHNNYFGFGTDDQIYGIGYPIIKHAMFPASAASYTGSKSDKPVQIPCAKVMGEAKGRKYPYRPTSILNVSAMSYGAMGRNAISALNKGAKAANCYHNTGEGGCSKFHRFGADICFQIGTGYFGCRDKEGRFSIEALKKAISEVPQIKCIEIKLSQGAKPGKGGILPAVKVTDEIAAIRGIPAGRDSISPNRHTDIASIGELLDRIAHIREVTGKPVGFKCVIGAYGWLDALFEEVARRGPDSAPDFITVDSGDGGTGAAPLPLIDNVGLPIRESLPMVDDIRKRHGMKDRVRLIASGKFVTPSGVAWALCAGADFVVAARGFMFALGCIQSLKCNKNTCPTGITTHNTRLQRGLNPADKGERVANYCISMRHEVEVIAHSCGVPEPRRLRRFHVRIVEGDGRSIPFNELYPSPDEADNDPAAAIKAGRHGTAGQAPVLPADITVPAQA